MDIRRIQVIKKGNDVIGTKTRIKLIKNKVAPPFKEAELIINSEGVDKVGSVLEAAISRGILDKSGAFIKYKEELLGQGFEAAKETLAKNPKLLEKIKTETLNKQ